jgi:hypothetical protein
MYSVSLTMSTAAGRNLASVQWWVSVDPAIEMLLYRNVWVEVLATVAMNNRSFCNMALGSQSKINQRYGATYWLHYQAWAMTQETVRREAGLSLLFSCFMLKVKNCSETSIDFRRGYWTSEPQKCWHVFARRIKAAYLFSVKHSVIPDEKATSVWKAKECLSLYMHLQNKQLYYFVNLQ